MDIKKEKLDIIIKGVNCTILPLEIEFQEIIDSIRDRLGETLFVFINDYLKRIDNQAVTIITKIKELDDLYISESIDEIKLDTHALLSLMKGTESLDRLMRKARPEYGDFFDNTLFSDIVSHRANSIESEEVLRREYQKVLEQKLIDAIRLTETPIEIELNYLSYILGLMNLLHNSIAGQSLMLFTNENGFYLGKDDKERLKSIINILGIALLGVEQVREVLKWTE